MKSVKQCYRCKEVKSIEDFHKNSRRPDGVTTACKPCAIEVRKEWALKNQDYVLQRDRQYYARNSAHCRQRESRRKTSSPERTSAHVAIREEIRSGRMVAQPCFICGSEAEAHHACYDMPLVVTWLCRRHHRQAHAESI